MVGKAFPYFVSWMAGSRLELRGLLSVSIGGACLGVRTIQFFSGSMVVKAIPFRSASDFFVGSWRVLIFPGPTTTSAVVDYNPFSGDH